jgi:hypothetical protein
MSRTELIASLLVLACLGALWPAVFGVSAPWYTAVKAAAVLVLVGVLVWRVRRMNAAFREARESLEHLAPGPPGGPTRLGAPSLEPTDDEPN